MWPGVDKTLLCHWLAWSQIAKWPRVLNSTCKSNYKPCVACSKKEFLILVTFRDHSWPDLDPDPYLVWHLCLQGIFTGPLRPLKLSFEQNTIDIAGPMLRHTGTSKFDLLPELDPSFQINLKILSILWEDDIESFRTPPRVAWYDHWFSR